MQRRHLWTALFLLGGSALTTVGAEIQLLPAVARLDGPKARQRFLVEAHDGHAFVGDRTGEARFTVGDPKVAAVSADGTVTPVGNGLTEVSATIDGQVARANISVENFERPTRWSFQNHVLSVLTKAGCNSGACHGAAAGKNGFRLTLRGYGPEVDFDVLTRQASGRRIVKTAPAESLLLLKPTGALEHGGGVKFSTDSLEYRVIAEWIAAGTPRPRADDPTIVSLAVVPESVLLKPAQAQQVLVQARFSDGHVEDVTRWAKFASTDDTVAKVDEQGKVKVEGHGEAAITVWYASRVQRTTVISPYEAKIDPTVFAAALRLNPIDEKNLAKLKALSIPPSPDAGDAAFLRRASLDATGTLPPAEQVEAFLADADPKKREKLVTRLLASPEFVDYWAYKWSDLLLVSSNTLPPPAMWSFYRFVRKSVADNVPWDQFARSIVTAKGSSLNNGAANYFALHRDPIDLTESSSMAFLGMSLTCARCHNHPMEKWTQDQYYGVASLFSRVQLKDGGAVGDVVVMASPEGETRHPRSGVIMPPRPLDGQPLALDWRGDRREAFADWLGQADNPYFARAIVNRVWRNFFGRGLIDPEDDLRATNPASDEPLMDWLVADFLAHKYDVKHLIQTIMSSAAYARSSVPVSGQPADPKYLSHYPVKRLPAEVILDAIARVAEVPTPFAGYPEGWRSLQLPDTKIQSTFLSSFGRPERISTCSCERSSEPSMSQALHLANGTTINEKLRHDTSAISKALAAKASDDEIIAGLFRAALTRRPTEGERQRLTAILQEAVTGLSDPKEAATARRQAIEDLYWATLTGNEFLFNH
ncbi:DUF1553 domain-containing protein [Singulisphaera acidiphila]|uniref:Ig-like domain-containing protein n=1 Tax=Singulisphaera acidiphila (strain ATCC BAA-1392 / DSM 18658 / VKM B-2454 / MOB10) TaxID=886293 RepID=L0DB85_SINAD|nr:DUF1553 domain-containing protein [Singulisphaera acidiphila]AGA25896.1 Ig-like domain-containing protein [Singulisphaera acidiphila DSM 18658]